MSERKVTPLEKARAAIALERERLSQIPVELQVRDVKHARSEEVLEFAIRELAKGSSWNVLRAKLGISQSASDQRWRVLRTLVVDGLMPATDEEALRAQISTRQFLLSKLEEHLDEIEKRIGQIGSGKLDKVVEHQFYRLRMEHMKLLIEENNNAFESYIEMHKLRQDAKRTTGPIVNVFNKFHIPRPGQNLKDVTEIAVDVIETKKKLEAADEK